MAAPVYFTAEMVRAMPDDGNRYEVVYGELLVTPSPRPWHQIVVQLSWSHMRTLLLVAEVLSPSTSRSDRFLKRIRFREAGVPLYWVVDGDAREPFSLSLEELFRPL